MPINLTYCWLAVLSLGKPCLTLRAAVAVQRGTRMATAVQISNNGRSESPKMHNFSLCTEGVGDCKGKGGASCCNHLDADGNASPQLLGSSIGLTVHPAHNRGREFNLSFCDITMAVAPSGALKHTMLSPHAVRNNAPSTAIATKSDAVTRPVKQGIQPDTTSTLRMTMATVCVFSTQK
jgi:hypothetical protein